MEDTNRVYRIRTVVGEDAPNVIHVPLKQSYDMFEILSLKLSQTNTYKTYESDYGVVVGRITANGGFGIPNAKVSIFIPVSDDEIFKDKLLYNFTSILSTDQNAVRYNLLPDFVDDVCHQNVGTFPNKRLVLDNKDMIEMFDKYWKYTTTTNHAGDYMLFGIPTGSQQLHVDVDLSDCGILSQRPYDMIGKGYNANMFESPNKFKYSTNLNSLAQIISQDKGVYVYPYWGDVSDGDDNFSITRCDVNLEYKFESYAVFMGSIVTDKGSNAIGKNCTADTRNGKMSDLIAGEGKIEMIRKTVDGKVEDFPIMGNRLIDGDGVWCYQIPMNLDYVTTDEFGSLVPTDNPEKGIATRARVRFRISLTKNPSDATARNRAMYLVPNNPREYDEGFINADYKADYNFGTETRDESFCDLLWNNVYTVKNYIPKLQKDDKFRNRKHTGIKLVNHPGDNSPMPYNSLVIDLGFTYRLICLITKVIINLIEFINQIFSVFGIIKGLIDFILDIPAKLLEKILSVLVILPKRVIRTPIRWYRGFIKTITKPLEWLLPNCIPVSSDFCDDGVNQVTYYPGCGKLFLNLGSISSLGSDFDLTWENTKKTHTKNEIEICQKNGYTLEECATFGETEPKNETAMLYNCVENELAQQNEATSFEFSNDWINGVLYAPLWHRKIKPKRSYLFGLIRKKAKDDWCTANRHYNSMRILQHCAIDRKRVIGEKDLEKEFKNFDNDDLNFKRTGETSCSGRRCQDYDTNLGNGKLMGVIVSETTMLGQTAYYYSSVQYDSALGEKNEDGNDIWGHKGRVMLLFATDIVLLGNLNECNLNGVPQFFKTLETTTYKLPSDILFTDYEFRVKLDRDGSGETVTDRNDETVYDVSTISEMAGCDWGNPNEFGKYDGGLFYSIGCTNRSVEMNPESCINLARICEFGVSLDETKEVADLKKMETATDDSIDDDDSGVYDKLITDGYISWDELYNLDERSMFATMNGNRLKTKLGKNGFMEYDFRYLYPDNFDGSLHDIMKKRTEGYPSRINYKDNYKLEQPSRDYYLFRMGNYPCYNDENHGNYTFPRYENSFYFYFGLKDGKTAIEKFNSMYFSECVNPDTIESQIGIKTSANSWCIEYDECEKRFVANECVRVVDKQGFSEANDGFVAFDFSKIPTPYDLLINGVSNQNYSLVVKEITEDKIVIINEENEENWPESIKDKGYVRLKTDNEGVYQKNGGYDVIMMNNGSYQGNITDAEGNITEFNFVIKPETLTYRIEIQDFEESNSSLFRRFRGKNDINMDSTYKSVAGDKDGLERDLVSKNVTRKIGGVVVISDIRYKNEPLKNYKIQVTPREGTPLAENHYGYEITLTTDEDGNRTIDSIPMGIVKEYDETNPDPEKYLEYIKTIIMPLYHNEKWCENCKGKISDTDQVPSPRPDGYCGCPNSKDDNGQYTRKSCICAKPGEEFYAFGLPKGGCEYTVRVTQLCDPCEEAEYNYPRCRESQNTVARHFLINEPMPFKMYINGIDYDVIKYFDDHTGWKLSYESFQDKTRNYGMVGQDPRFTKEINNFIYNKELETGEEYNDSSVLSPWYRINKMFRYIEGVEPNDVVNFFVETEGNRKVIKVKLVNGETTTIDDEILLKEFCAAPLIHFPNQFDVVPYNWVDTYLLDDYAYFLEENGNGGYYLSEYYGLEEENFGLNFQEVIEQFAADINRVFELRKELVSMVKRTFFMYCNGQGMSIYVTGSTSKGPLTKTLSYHEEEAVEGKEYNKLVGDKTVTDADKLRIGSVDDIRIPTITYGLSEDFGDGESGEEPCLVKNNLLTNNKDRNIQKKPYSAAVMNAQPCSVPLAGEGTVRYECLNSESDKEGVPPYYVSRKECPLCFLFNFPIIDKILTVDYVAWSAFIKLPKYGFYSEGGQQKPYKDIVTMNGLVAAYIYNGNTMNERFEIQTLNNLDLLLSKNLVKNKKSYIEKRVIYDIDYTTLGSKILDLFSNILNFVDNEANNLTNDMVQILGEAFDGFLNPDEDAPIIQPDKNNMFNILKNVEYNETNNTLVYNTGQQGQPPLTISMNNIINNIKDKVENFLLNFTEYYTYYEQEAEDKTQYAPLFPITTEFVVGDNSCQFNNILDGTFKVELSEDSVNDCKSNEKIFGISTEDNDTTYYVYKVFKDDKNWYPINLAINDRLIWQITEPINGDDTFQYDHDHLQNIFSLEMKNLSEHVDVRFISKVLISEEGEEERYTTVRGYGTTGKFYGSCAPNLFGKEYIIEYFDDLNYPIYVIGENSDKVRALSPVYDYSNVYAYIKYGILERIEYIYDAEHNTYEIAEEPIRDYKLGVAIKKGHFYFDNYPYTMYAICKIDSVNTIEILEDTLEGSERYLFGTLTQYMYESLKTKLTDRRSKESFFKGCTVTGIDYAGLRHICGLDDADNSIKETKWYTYVWIANRPNPNDDPNSGIIVSEDPVTTVKTYEEAVEFIYEENHELEEGDIMKCGSDDSSIRFLGWSENQPDSTATIDVSILVGTRVNSCKIFFGNWSDVDDPTIMHTVKFFDSDESTLLGIQRVPNGHTIDTTTIPIRDRDWYVLGDATKQTFVLSTQITDDLSLVLKPIEYVRVTWFADLQSNPISEYPIPSGTQVNPPVEIPNNWCLAEGGAFLGFPYIVNEDTNFYGAARARFYETEQSQNPSFSDIVPIGTYIQNPSEDEWCIKGTSDVVQFNYKLDADTDFVKYNPPMPPQPTTYTVRFLDSDGSTEIENSEQHEAGYEYQSNPYPQYDWTVNGATVTWPYTINGDTDFIKYEEPQPTTYNVTWVYEEDEQENE